MASQYFQEKSHVSTYSKFRPSPPQNLIQEIVKFTSEKIPGPLQMVVDVGCGSGQSSEVFAPYFTKVHGVDSSESIIREAILKCRYPNVFYSQGSAENIPVENHSANLVSVCQSIHWFDITKFYDEANRILCENGVLALFGYNLPIPVVDGAHSNLSTIVRKYYEDVLGEFVLPQSKMAYIESYMSKEFNEVPFIAGGKMQRKEGFASEVEGTLSDLTGYISSWSTYQNYAKHKGKLKAASILKDFEDEFKRIIDKEIDSSFHFKIRFNYFLLFGRKNLD